MSEIDPAAPASMPTSALRDAVALAYATFRHDAPLAFPLDVCLGCCVSATVERELRERPLARLTTHHLRQYNESAKGRVQPVDELRHLLPRLLESIALGEEVHHSTEIYLDRLGRCPEGSWSDDERAALDAFALACFDAVLCPAANARGAHWLDDPLTVLVMFDIGGIDIGPLLDLWLRSEDPASTIRYVESTYWHFWEEREVANAFADDRPALRARLREWLLEPAHRRRFAGKMTAPEFVALVPHQAQVGRVTFREMVDAAFVHGNPVRRRPE